MKRSILGLVAMVLLVSLTVAGCAGDEGAQGPKGDTGAQGPKGDTGSAGPAPSEEELEHLVADVISGGHVSDESIAAGGRLYNKWWAEAGVDAPTADHPLMALQTTNARTGADSQRCKECHGWDYKGKGGAYSSGSHFTGFPGVIEAGATMSKAELLDVLMGSTDYRHDFSDVLSVENLTDLANFLSEGLINDTLYIDYNASGKPVLNPDLMNGATLFASTCALCHGADGKQILIDGELSIGWIANNEPTVEILHIIRTGFPGTEMPSSLVNGWSIKDAADVLAHVQTLPTE